MRSILTLLTVSSFAAVTLAAYSWPASSPASGESFRVSGNQSPATQSGDTWKYGDFKTEAPLPAGYVAPTPKNAIEVKSYPTVRRAEISSADIFMDEMMGQSRAFWALFNHIKARKIPMTGPVEFDFKDADSSRKFLGLGSINTEWKMSFDYRTSDLGALGNCADNVKVVDAPEVTVISIGVDGGFMWNRLNDAVDTLRKALKSQSTWVAAGEPRWFAYNSPMTWHKWSEVQIPIKLAV